MHERLALESSAKVAVALPTAVRRHGLSLRFRTASITEILVWLQLGVLALPRDVATLPIVYASPVLTVVALLVTTRLRVQLRTAIPLACVVLVSLVVALVGPSHVLNVVLSLATYSSVALLIVGSNRGDHGRPAIVAWGRALVVVAVFHTLVGVLQLVGEGFPFRLPYRDFSPDVFSSVLGDGGHRLIPLITGPAAVLVALRLLRTGTTVAGGLVFALLVVGVVGPGSNASVLGLVAAALLTFATVVGASMLRAARVARPVIRFHPVRMTAFVVPLVVVLGALGVVATLVSGGLPHFSDSISRIVESPSDSVRSPKTAVALQTIFDLPREVPSQPVFGLGLGNYSSWSQLLLSGVYAERFLDGAGTGVVPVSYRREAWDYVLFHMTAEMRARYGFYYIDSIATQPWSSWQSLYAETGLLGLLLIAAALAVPLRRLRLEPSDPGWLRDTKLTVGFALWFVVVMGFTDNLFEYPWLMVPPLLGLALLPDRRR